MTFPLNDICKPITVNNMGIFDLFDLNTKLGTKKNYPKPSFLPFLLPKTPTESQSSFPLHNCRSTVHDYIDKHMDVFMLLLDRQQALHQNDLDFAKTKNCTRVYQHANYFCINIIYKPYQYSPTIPPPNMELSTAECHAKEKAIFSSSLKKLQQCKPLPISQVPHSQLDTALQQPKITTINEILKTNTQISPRISLAEIDSWNFCYVIPPDDPQCQIDDIDIVVPDALQMGWTESPPYFCASTETARDAIEWLVNSPTPLPQHPLEQHICNKAPSSPTAIHTMASIIEVYMDDFILATNNLTEDHLQHLARAVLHSIHSIFPPPLISKHTGEDPITIKNYKVVRASLRSKRKFLVGYSMEKNLPYSCHHIKPQK